jgi:hypothetical protein
MKIFISWSGQRSKAVAELISDWFKCVIQASQPWISTRDIDRGAIWFSEISDQLKNTSAGIICLTQENKDKPWILFETGALAKGLTTNRVCTFLVDLQPSELEDPLAQFNHTTPEKNSMWELVRSLNAFLAEQGLDERILEQVFKTYWPQFELGFKKALEENLPTISVAPRPDSDILAEILNYTRSLNYRVREIESRIELDKKSEQFDEFAKLAETKHMIRIMKMLRSGLSDETIVNSLVDYDMPETYATQLLNRVRKNLGKENPNVS